MKYVNKMYSLLDACTNFKYDGEASVAYNGEGFYVNHNKRVLEEVKNWCYDIHWAYGSSLINNIFPLSNEMQDEPTQLGIIQIEFKLNKGETLGDHRRYKDFYYTLYTNNKMFTEKKNVYSLFLTNIDYEIFKDLYTIPHEVLGSIWFKDIGPLSDELKDYVRQAYNDKQEMKKTGGDKSIFEAAFYGLFAKSLQDLYKDKEKEAIKTGDKKLLKQAEKCKEEYNKAFRKTGVQIVRSKYVPIALFQTAHLRLREYKLFKENIDNVIYMNTDSIFANKPLNIKTSDKLGDYGVEYNGLPIQYIRRNAYIVKNIDGSIKKQVIGGVDKVLNKLTIEQCKELKTNPDGITIKMYDENHKIVDRQLEPWFKLKNSGEAIDVD